MTDKVKRLQAYIEELEELLYNSGGYDDEGYSWDDIREMREDDGVAELLPPTPLEFWEEPDYVPPPPPDPNDPFFRFFNALQPEETPFLRWIKQGEADDNRTFHWGQSDFPRERFRIGGEGEPIQVFGTGPTEDDGDTLTAGPASSDGDAPETDET